MFNIRLIDRFDAVFEIQCQLDHRILEHLQNWFRLIAGFRFLYEMIFIIKNHLWQKLTINK